MEYNKNNLKIFLSIVLISFLVVGFINYKNISNNKYLSEEIKMLIEERNLDYFQKKIKCEKYVDSIKKEL